VPCQALVEDQPDGGRTIANNFAVTASPVRDEGAASPGGVVEAAGIGQRRPEGQDAAEDVPALRDPGDGLDAQGMDRPQQRGERGGDFSELESARPQRQERRGGGMEEEVREMEAQGVAAPERAVDRER
jgi:hypothetical protein